MGGYCGLDIYSAVIGNDKIRRVEGKIHFQFEMLHDREEVELPEAGIERRLELFYEFSVTVLKAACPFIQHFAIDVFAYLVIIRKFGCCASSLTTGVNKSLKSIPSYAPANFESSCSKGDAMRAISALLRPCRADSSRHFDTALPT